MVSAQAANDEDEDGRSATAAVRDDDPRRARNAADSRRAELLARYGILDTEAEAVFDDLTALASSICEAPISLVSLLDGDRQWFKSHCGTELTETPIATSICALAVDGAEDGIFEIGDTAADERTRDMSLVVGDPQIRAYLGSPLRAPDGTALGTLCVIDSTTRTFTEAQREALRILSRQAVGQLELRRRLLEVDRQRLALASLNQQLEQFTYIVGHDLKAPIRHQASFAMIIEEDHADELSEEVREYLRYIIRSGEKAQRLIDDLNDYVHTVQAAGTERHPVRLPELIEEVVKLVGAGPEVRLEVDVTRTPIVETSTAALRHILYNLCANAVKYNRGKAPTLRVESARTAEATVITVADNGPGILPTEQRRVFELFRRGSSSEGSEGRGLGLAIAAKLAQNLGGSLELDNAVTGGARFVLTLPR